MKSFFSITVWENLKAQTFIELFSLCSPKKFGEAYSPKVVRPSVSPSVSLYVPNSCLAHNFVIWSRILKLFHRNDHHIEMTCRAHHLGRYLEGQGHSMTLQRNCVRPITLLFEVGFYSYFWQTTSLCPIPIRGALPGSTGSCFLDRVRFPETLKLFLRPKQVRWHDDWLLLQVQPLHRVPGPPCDRHLVHSVQAGVQATLRADHT